VGDSASVTEGGTVTTLDSAAASVLANDTDADLPGDTLRAVLPDCADPVPTLVSTFDIEQTEGELIVTWRTSSNVPDEMLRLVISGNGGWLEIPFQSYPDWFSIATISLSRLDGMGSAEILLEMRSADGMWSALMVENIELEVPSFGARFLNVSPNPFNPRTVITFEVPKQQLVQIAAHDIAGRRVALLMDEVVEAGQHGITWDGAGAEGEPLASGTYFIRMVTEVESQVAKVLLVR